MLDNSERLHLLVESLKRFQFVLNKPKKVQDEFNEEDQSIAQLSKLPTELIVQILYNLNAQDVARFAGACKRFSKICAAYRPCLARKQLKTLAVRYGVWHDVLKQRVALSDSSTISYHLFDDDNFRLQRPIKKRAGFFSKPTPPFNGLIRNCSFETALLSVEMLNIDLKKALHLKVLDAKYIYFDLSHHSLQKRQLQRYLPDIASDLNLNPYVQNVDFIFNTIDETSNCELEKIITDRMLNKKVTLIFLKTRSTFDY